MEIFWKARGTSQFLNYSYFICGGQKYSETRFRECEPRYSLYTLHFQPETMPKICMFLEKNCDTHFINFNEASHNGFKS